MVKLPKGWEKNRDIRFPENILLVSPSEFVILEVSPDWEPPFKSKKPKDWMFSVWEGKQIIRKHNKVFKTKAQAMRYAIGWARKHPEV